jgi:hypothetical protein
VLRKTTKASLKRSNVPKDWRYNDGPFLQLRRFHFPALNFNVTVFINVQTLEPTGTSFLMKDLKKTTLQNRILITVIKFFGRAEGIIKYPQYWYSNI